MSLHRVDFCCKCGLASLDFTVLVNALRVNKTLKKVMIRSRIGEMGIAVGLIQALERCNPNITSSFKRYM